MKTYKLKINGHDYQVDINGIEGNIANVSVNGVSYSVELENAPAAAQAPSPVAAPKATAAPAAVASAPVASAPSAPAASGAGKTIASPLPGVIIDLCVKEGQAVKKGQKVAVLEAMKMENDILAECDGTIAGVHVSKGDSVLEGAKIVTIA